MDAKGWIEKLGLGRHPEGGYFKETYRSDIQVNLPGCGARSACTAIYYLLEGNEFSAFHRIKSDEIWHHYAGSPVFLHVIDNDGSLLQIRVGGERPQAVIKADCWFAASVENRDSFSLVGCTVAPGFDFMDLEFADSKLAARYPQHQKTIEKFLR